MSTNTIRPTEFRAMQKNGQIPAPSNKVKKNTRGVPETTEKSVDAVANNAFVPDMQNKEPISANDKMSAFFASMSAEKITTPTLALPSNGQHYVVLMSYEYKNGYQDNSDYFRIELKDVEKNITWSMTLPANPKDVMEFLGEVNMYNKGMVYGLDPSSAFGKLENAQFRVWTQQFKNEKGEDRVKTYSNPVKYDKFARYIAFKNSEKKEADKAYKEKKAAEKAAEDDTAPWED